MIRKHRVSIMLMALSLVFALFSLQDSSALSSGSMERGAMASIADDGSGILKIDGLDGQRLYDIDKDFNKIGSITNNTNGTIHLMVMITPDFLFTSNNGYKLRVKIGEQVIEFKHNSDPSQQATLQLNPGQEVAIQAGLHNNKLALVTTSLSFTAVDTNGTYTMQLNDTLKTPRRFIIY